MRTELVRMLVPGGGVTFGGPWVAIVFGLLFGLWAFLMWRYFHVLWGISTEELQSDDPIMRARRLSRIIGVLVLGSLSIYLLIRGFISL